MLGGLRGRQIGCRHGDHRAHQRPGQRHETEQILQRPGHEEDCCGERTERSGDQRDMRRRRASGHAPGAYQEDDQNLRRDRLQEPAGLELRRVRAETLQENQEGGGIKQG